MRTTRGLVISTSEAAEILRRSPQTLRDWHDAGRGPASTRAHSKAAIRWSRAQVVRLAKAEQDGDADAVRAIHAEMGLLPGKAERRTKRPSVSAVALRRRRKLERGKATRRRR